MDFRSSLAVEERVFSLFQPDTLMPDQYLSTFRRKSDLPPEKRLILAILHDGVDCFQKYAAVRDRKRKALFREAENWIFNDDMDDWLFSFDNVCEVLGLSPHYVRRELLRWRENKTARPPKKRLARGSAQARPHLFR